MERWVHSLYAKTTLYEWVFLFWFRSCSQVLKSPKLTLWTKHHHCVRWRKSWWFELFYCVASGCLRWTLWVSLHDFNLKLKYPNRNNIIAKLKSPDSASLNAWGWHSKILSFLAMWPLSWPRGLFQKSELCWHCALPKANYMQHWFLRMLIAVAWKIVPCYTFGKLCIKQR